MMVAPGSEGSWVLSGTKPMNSMRSCMSPIICPADMPGLPA